jgi:predicted aconitase
MFNFTKQSSERYLITLDFTDVLATAETIAVKSVIAYLGIENKTTDVITSSTIVGKTIVIGVHAGTNRNAYKITTIITTSLANVFEEDILMEVEDI